MIVKAVQVQEKPASVVETEGYFGTKRNDLTCDGSDKKLIFSWPS